jgi:hypothetical protein
MELVNKLLSGRQVYASVSDTPGMELSRIGVWPLEGGPCSSKPLFVRSDVAPDTFVEVQGLIERMLQGAAIEPMLIEILGPPIHSWDPSLTFMTRPVFADVIVRSCFCDICKSKLVQGPGLFPKMYVTLERAFEIAQKMMDPATGLEFVLACAQGGCMFHDPVRSSSDPILSPFQFGPAAIPDEFMERILHLRMLMKDMANAFQETMAYYSSTLRKSLLMCRIQERDGPAMDAVKLVDRTSSMLYHLWTAGKVHWQSASRLRANIFLPFIHHKVPGKFDFQASMRKDSGPACPVCESAQVASPPSPPSSCLSCISCKLFFCAKCDRYGAEPFVCCNVGMSRVAALMKRAEAEGVVCIEIED